jgi:hypothetical protein
VRHKGFTHLGARAGHQIEHAGRKACLIDDLGEQIRAQPGNLARLGDHRASGDQRRCHLEGELIQREVPRCDRADHSDGLAPDAGIADLLDLEQRLDRIGGVVEGVYGDTELGVHGLRPWCADFANDAVQHLIPTLLQSGGDRTHQLDAPRNGRGRPQREGPPRRGHRGVHVCGRARRNAADDLASGWVDHLDRGPRRRGDPLAVDVGAISDDQPTLSFSLWSR